MLEYPYSIAGDAKVTGIAKIFVANAHGASAGKGAIVHGCSIHCPIC